MECFGTSSTDVISPVTKINYNGTDYNLESGPVAESLFNEITDIQTGRKEHAWGHVVA